MRPAPDWSRIESELQYARAAREFGKEGRARVSARRAAGWAVGAYLRQRALPGPRGAFELLGWLEREGPARLHEAAARLRRRVTVDHRLPHGEDPLADAELIVRELRAGTSATTAPAPAPLSAP